MPFWMMYRLDGSNFLLCSTCLTCLQLGFMLLALIWKFDFPPFMVLIIAILNDGSLFLSLSLFPVACLLHHASMYVTLSFIGD